MFGVNLFAKADVYLREVEGRSKWQQTYTTGRPSRFGATNSGCHGAVQESGFGNSQDP